MKTPREKFIEIVEKTRDTDCSTKNCKKCIFSSTYNKTQYASCSTIRPIIYSGAELLTNQLPPSNNIQKILQHFKAVSPDDLYNQYRLFCRCYPCCRKCPLHKEVFTSIGMSKYTENLSCEVKFAASVMCGIDPADWAKEVKT